MIRDVNTVWPMLWQALPRHPLLVLHASRSIVRNHRHYGISLGGGRPLFMVFANAFSATGVCSSTGKFVRSPTLDDLRRAAVWIKTEWAPLQENA